MSARTIQVTLTEAQYRALAAAVAERALALEEQERPNDVGTLNRAWDAAVDGWRRGRRG